MDNQIDKAHDGDIRKEFECIPFFVQENIKQSGIKIQSSEHLRQIAKNLTNK